MSGGRPPSHKSPVSEGCINPTDAPLVPTAWAEAREDSGEQSSYLDSIHGSEQ